MDRHYHLKAYQSQNCDTPLVNCLNLKSNNSSILVLENAIDLFKNGLFPVLLCKILASFFNFKENKLIN